MQQLGSALLAAQLKRTQLAMKYSPDYPLVKEAEQEVDQAKAAIAEAEKNHIMTRTTDQDATYELLREDLAKTRADLATQQATAASLSQSISDLRGQTISLDQKFVKQQDLLREAKANEDNYLLYLVQARTGAQLGSDGSGPRRQCLRRYAAGGTGAARVQPFPDFRIGVSVLNFREHRRSIYRGVFRPVLPHSSEVNEMLRVPVLASIPRQAA